MAKCKCGNETQMKCGGCQEPICSSYVEKVAIVIAAVTQWTRVLNNMAVTGNNNNHRRARAVLR